MSKILIIEDEAAIRRVLTKILTEENDSYKVEEAEDGLQGLEKVKNEDFDLVSPPPVTFAPCRTRPPRTRPAPRPAPRPATAPSR